jgi:hypothetical protein
MGKSTGPRTARGKARSCKNAATHWIESGRILQSEQEVAGFLRHGFMEDFNPQGLAENEVIDDIVMNRLIRRRTDVAFTREFSKASAVKSLIWLENHEGSAIRFWLRSSFSRGRHPSEQGPRCRPDLCIEELEALRDRIKERGPQPDEDLPALRRIYGGEPTEHAAVLLDGLARIVEGHSTETIDQDELKKWMVGGIEVEIEAQKLRLEITTNFNDAEFASHIQEPVSLALDLLLRYRAANTREFKVLLDSLDRIRHLRRSAH